MSPSDKSILAAALWYGEHGYHVFPVHNPIFDAAGTVIGCTCEAYRQSDACKENHPKIYLGPDGKCDNPGKCPRVRWGEKATTDAKRIRAWFSRPWRDGHVPNIGIDAGKSGLLILDADKYKEGYESIDGLDTETITNLAAGEQYWYRADPEHPYSNANGGLPFGNDIRGVGGYVVVPPSQHKSGRVYQFEIGYGPRDRDPAPIPAILRLLLDNAQRRATAAAPVELPTDPGDCPDLAAFILSDHILDLINEPPAKGQRSEADMSVAVALVAAGADDGAILAVFTHYPIGYAGKFAERGRDYLARTIAGARAYIAEHPGPQQIRAEIEQLIAWAKSTSFADLVPADLQSTVGYRTDATDTAVAVAILTLCHERGTWKVRISLRYLAELAGKGTHKTIANALNRLAGWFLNYDPGSHLVEVVARLASISPTHCEILANLATTYQNELPDDPYLAGVSRTMRKYGKTLAGELGIQPVPFTVPDGSGGFLDKERAAWRVALDEHALKAIGEGGLRVIDALEGRGGAMTRRELASATGKAVSGIATATRRLEEYKILCTDRAGSVGGAKRYELKVDWQSIVESLRTQFMTHGLATERKIRHAEATRDYAADQLGKAAAGQIVLDEERERQLNRTRGKAEGRLRGLLPFVFPGMNEEEIAKWAETASSRAAWGPDSPEVTVEKKIDEAAAMLEWLGNVVRKGALLTKSELAKARTYAGRLGIDLSQYVDAAGGYAWAAT